MKIYTNSNNILLTSNKGTLITNLSVPSYDLVLTSEMKNFILESGFIQTWRDTSTLKYSLDATQNIMSSQPYWFDDVDGSSAVFFDDNDYLEISDHPEFHLSDDDFTFECHVKFIDDPLTKSFVPFSHGDDSDNMFTFYYPWATDKFAFYFEKNGNPKLFSFSGWLAKSDIWYHIAFSRKRTETNEEYRFYVDGVLIEMKIGEKGDFGDYELPIQIGRYKTLNGYNVQTCSLYLDNIKFIKGDALYVKKSFNVPMR